MTDPVAELLDKDWMICKYDNFDKWVDSYDISDAYNKFNLTPEVLVEMNNGMRFVIEGGYLKMEYQT